MDGLFIATDKRFSCRPLLQGIKELFCRVMYSKSIQFFIFHPLGALLRTINISLHFLGKYRTGGRCGMVSPFSCINIAFEELL